jgi:hypothetical protein
MKNSIREQALKEIEEENARAAIDAYKAKLREQKWYHKIFPWRIVFIRKEKL